MKVIVMWSIDHLLEVFQNYASRPLGGQESLYAEVDLCVPFDQLYIAVGAERLSIHSATALVPFEES